MNAPVPPGMVRLASGQLVKAAQMGTPVTVQAKKFLIVLQYYAGDMAAVEEQANLIADLERVQNHQADVVVYARGDAPEFSRTIMAKLGTKFDKVGFLRCRRRDGKGYPFGPNQMFSDLVTLLGQDPVWQKDYYAFLNLESDCTPLHPGWIEELASAYRDAAARGYAAIGHQHGNPVDHLNGVAVYAIDIWRRVPGQRLNGADPRIPYDIYHAQDLLGISTDTPLIVLDFQRPTITTEDLYKPHKGREAAIFHGVKDNSARVAVRAKHIARGGGDQDLSRKTVFAFYQPAPTLPQTEAQNLMRLWREGWTSRGWNPVVLGLREAVKNPRHKLLMAKVEKFPFVGDKQAALNCYLRWLALGTMGGGLMADLDVLPGQFTPADAAQLITGFNCFAGEQERTICALYADRENIDRWLDEMMKYDTQPADLYNGMPCVTDLTIFQSNPDFNETCRVPLTVLYGQPQWKDARLIHFSRTAIQTAGAPNDRKMNVVDRYLRGV